MGHSQRIPKLLSGEEPADQAVPSSGGIRRGIGYTIQIIGLYYQKDSLSIAVQIAKQQLPVQGAAVFLFFCLA